MSEHEKVAESSEALTYDERLKVKAKRLKSIYKYIPKEKKKMVLESITNMAFMEVTMEDLRLEINDSGSTEEYKNGENQFGKKQSSALSSYNSVSKNYLAYIKQLDSMIVLPKKPQEKEDGLDNFVDKRED